MLIIVVLLICIFAGISCYLNYSTAEEVIRLSLTETADISAERITAEISSIQNISKEVGCNVAIANSDTPLSNKKQIIDQKVEMYDYEEGNVINAEGTSIFDGTSHANTDYFNEAMQGESFISGPYILEKGKKLKYIVSSPIWKDGVPNSQVVGVVYFCPNSNFLIDIVADITVGETGYAYIIDKEGTNVADAYPEVVGVENTIADAKTDKQLEDCSVMEHKMINGEHGYGIYMYENDRWVQAYAPIENTDGWSIGVASMMKDCLKYYFISIAVIGIISIIFLIFTIIIATSFATRISKPIKETTERILKLSEGDLTTEVADNHRKDETGVLTHATKVLVNELNDVIRDLTNILGQMAEGNFRVHSQATYKGDFLPIQTATDRIISSLNFVLNQINQSSNQVSIGSGQVAIGAQTLSESSIQQSKSIEDVSDAVNEILIHVRENADIANQANDISNTSREKLLLGNQEMADMVKAMDEITITSKEIGRIIKLIDDIAFQTNILALNAAVEAARAGDAGKGFAVVADEVRNLAAKSAEAAKDTATLIDSAIRAVDNGSQIADSTEQTMKEMADAVESLGQIISKISELSNEQAESIEQITQTIEQISGVVQSNSATAEESAASSEELSGQAEILKDLVGKFSLLDSSKN
jgi:methyl-accepting chemotaxis protein